MLKNISLEYIFKNYEITLSGDIMHKKTGKMLRKYKLTKNRNVICVTIEGNRVQVARIVYARYAKPITNSDIIKYKDGDYTNCSFSNLYIISRSEMKKNVTKISRQDAKTIKQRYLIENMGKVGKGKHANLPVHQLALEYGVSDSTIRNIINNKSI